jgi:hypothetical protein
MRRVGPPAERSNPVRKRKTPHLTVARFSLAEREGFPRLAADCVSACPGQRRADPVSPTALSCGPMDVGPCLAAARSNPVRKRKTPHLTVARFSLAEREGFEPSIPCGIPAFQAGALDHYATSPRSGVEAILQVRRENATVVRVGGPRGFVL